MATGASLIFLYPLFLSLQISLLPFVFSYITSHPFLCMISLVFKILNLCSFNVLIFQLLFRPFKLIFFLLLITRLFSSTRVKSRIVTTRIYYWHSWFISTLFLFVETRRYKRHILVCYKLFWNICLSHSLFCLTMFTISSLPSKCYV